MNRETLVFGLEEGTLLKYPWQVVVLLDEICVVFFRDTHHTR